MKILMLGKMSCAVVIYRMALRRTTLILIFSSQAILAIVQLPNHSLLAALSVRHPVQGQSRVAFLAAQAHSAHENTDALAMIFSSFTGSWVVQHRRGRRLFGIVAITRELE